MREPADELLEAIRSLHREIRQLRHGELVARLTEAERDAIAQQVLDRLDERYAAERTGPAVDHTPRRETKRGRGVRRYFEG